MDKQIASHRDKNQIKGSVFDMSATEAITTLCPTLHASVIMTLWLPAMLPVVHGSDKYQLIM